MNTSSQASPDQDQLKTYTLCFLGPRGPLVLPLIGPARPSVRAKNLDHLYTGIYAL